MSKKNDLSAEMTHEEMIRMGNAHTAGVYHRMNEERERRRKKTAIIPPEIRTLISNRKDITLKQYKIVRLVMHELNGLMDEVAEYTGITDLGANDDFDLRTSQWIITTLSLAIDANELLSITESHNKLTMGY
jgi:hypothetical protein